MFTARKVAQMAAVFTSKQGGTINVLKLSKLLYLADRESMNRYGMPISFDNVVSMDNGPVLSKTLDLLNGSVGGPDGAKWDEWISDRENHNVSLRREFNRQDLDEISDVDLEVLDTVWSQFGKMDRWTIRDYTHEHCPEWKDPKGSAYPIDDKDILIAVGKPPEEASALAENIRAQRNLDQILSSL